MPNSGFTVTRTVFFEAPTGRFRLTTTKAGAATTANGFASGAGAKAIAVEAGKTLLLDKEALKTLAEEKKTTIYGYGPD